MHPAWSPFAHGDSSQAHIHGCHQVARLIMSPAAAVGRPSLCLKCKGTGHLRKNCKAPYCRHYQEYGHSSESCSAEKAKQASWEIEKQ